jgi:hypothetical protein
MNPIIITLPNLTIGNVQKIYVGKPNACMCGCSGKYTYNSVNRESASKARGYEVEDEDVNDMKTLRLLAKMKAHESLGIEVLNDHIYTIIIGTRQYTLYKI